MARRLYCFDMPPAGLLPERLRRFELTEGREP